MTQLTAISLFSGGVGGLDIAAHYAGFDILAQVEIDEFNRRLLRRHYPNTVQFADVRDVGRHNLPTVDVIFGGFPCQPHSHAGDRKGADDSRNLWPEFARIIRELRPRCVLLENVPGILSATRLVDGTTRPAYAFTVIADLQQMGYVGRAGVVSASDAGAAHKRERWFCVAYASSQRHNQPAAAEDVYDNSERHTAPHQQQRAAEPSQVVAGGKDVGYANGAGCQECNPTAVTAGTPQRAGDVDTHGVYGQPEPGLGRSANGIPPWLVSAPIVARPGEIQHKWEAPRTVTESPVDRAKRLQSLGNGVVPQVAYPIFCEIAKVLSR
jgi:DNA (cytosine-5)-methyltransferase 1